MENTSNQQRTFEQCQSKILDLAQSARLQAPGANLDLLRELIDWKKIVLENWFNFPTEERVELINLSRFVDDLLSDMSRYLRLHDLDAYLQNKIKLKKSKK